MSPPSSSVGVSRARNQHEAGSKISSLFPDSGFKSYNIIRAFQEPEGSLLRLQEPHVHLDLGVLRGFFHSEFSTDILYAFLISAMRAISLAYLVIFDLITLIIFS
jgi:hypothetical protein